MKTNFFLFFLYIISLPVVAGSDECAKIAYIPFYISLYGSETEESIEKSAMRRQFITSSKLTSIMTEELAPRRSGYMEDNTKVVIKLYGGDVFIDANGRMRKGEQYADIDTSRFEEVLIDKCP